MTNHTASGDVRPMVAPPGGVMTREVGAVTGDLEVWLDPRRPGTVHVRYAGASEAYTVAGRAPDPARCADLDAVVAALQVDPGVDGDGNPRATDLGAVGAPTAGAAQGSADGVVAPADRGAPAAQPGEQPQRRLGDPERPDRERHEADRGHAEHQGRHRAPRPERSRAGRSR